MCRRVIASALLSMMIGPLVSIPSTASERDLGDWRALTAEEEKARIGDTPAASVDPALIEADFDGDGKKDKALIAIRKTDGARGLIAFMNGRVYVIDLERTEPSTGLGLAERGSWDTICGNAFRELQGGLCEMEKYPTAVTLKNPGILHINPGEAVLHYWDPKKKSFRTVVLRN